MAEASEKSFPFDAKDVNGVYDRVYIAEDFARYFRRFITTGVFMDQSTNLQIIANGDMTVTLKPGGLITEGYGYENEDDIIIQIDPADGVLNRIDRIAITWSRKDRDIHYTVQKGVSGYEPVVPEARRTAEYRDYVVADVYVAAGAISIRQADITDQRLNSTLCGLAAAFCKIDTTKIFNQFMDWFQKIRDEGETGLEELLSSHNETLTRYEEQHNETLTQYEQQHNETLTQYEQQHNEALTQYEEQHDRRITEYENQQFERCDSLLKELYGLISDTAAGELKLEIDAVGDRMEKAEATLGEEDIADIGSGSVTGAIRHIWELLRALTANGAITEVKIVDALPADAASHPATFYWVKG